MSAPLPPQPRMHPKVPNWVWYVLAALVVIAVSVFAAVVFTSPSNNARSADVQSVPTTASSTSSPSVSSMKPTTSSTRFSPSIITPSTVTSTAPPQDFFPAWTGDNAQQFAEESVSLTLDAAYTIDNRIKPASTKVRLTPADKVFHCGGQKLDGSSALDAPTIIWCKEDGRFYTQYAAMTARIGSNRDGAIIDVLQAVGRHLLILQDKPNGNSACAAGALAIKLVDTGKLSIEKARNLAAYATDRTNYTVGLDGIAKC